MEYFGLSEKEVQVLKKKFGENSILGKEKISSFSILLSQLKNPLVFILTFVGIISLLAKEFFDFCLILGVLILNTLMGFFQEYNAKKTLVSLRKILKPQTLVIREGKRKIIDIKDLVPGDIVVLFSGDKIPADGVLLEGEVLVNEAILTGEETAVTKKPTAEKNLFMGTIVLSGKGIMEVKNIGFQTEIGKIGKGLIEIEEGKTPLQERLEDLSKKLAIIILSICTVLFFLAFLRQSDILLNLRTAIVLAVAAIPEALPVTITIILTLGMKRILKKKGLVKTLLAVETLGSTSVICTDKTGTLTEGKMKVVETFFLDREKSILNIILNNEQKTSLELAVFKFGQENLTEEIEQKIKIAKEIFEEPFDSEKKYSLSIQKIGEKEISFLMGGPEIILNFCQNEEREKKEIFEKLESWAKRGLRVLGLAFKEDGEKKHYIFSGLLGISDPPRKEVKDLIAFAEKAGISVKIVTGDYRKTAEVLAKNLGIQASKENIIEGEEIEKISTEELKEKIEKISIFARVLPHQKRKIVDCLQKKGEIVAMTGDGVNDALALKEADIGIAVGEATEVAKEAADLVLLDSNFKTIISACEEGRLILSNIKKTVGYILSNSFLEIALIFLAGIFGFPPPLNIVQILWLHLICDGPPDLTFAFEPPEKDLMEKKPADIKKESILDPLLFFLIFIVTVATTSLCLYIYWLVGIKENNLLLGSTLVFASLGAVDLIYIFSFKNLKKPILKTENFFANKFLFLSILYGFSLLFLAIYHPFLNKILKTTPLREPWQIGIIFGIGILVTLLLELAKTIFHEKSSKSKI